MEPGRSSATENSDIDEVGRLYKWSEDLAAGRLTREQLKVGAQEFARGHGPLAVRVQALTKLARDAELDHRAGQTKSAEAKATVVVAASHELESALPGQADKGFFGRILGSGQRMTDLLLVAASQAHATLGGLARDRGDLSASEREYLSALELARRMHGGELPIGAALLGLGHTYRLQGRMREAEESLVEAHPHLVNAQGSSYVPLDMYFLGIVQAATGRRDEALSTLEQTEAAYAAQGVSNGVLDARLARADVLIQGARFSEAEHVAQDALRMAEQLDKSIYMAQAHLHLGRIKRAEKQPDEAVRLFREAIKLYERAGDSQHSAQAFMAIAEVERQRGRLDEASQALDQAQRIASETRSSFIEADCAQSRALLALATGDAAQARRLFEKAKSMYLLQRRDDQVRKTNEELDKLTAGSR